MRGERGKEKGNRKRMTQDELNKKIMESISIKTGPKKRSMRIKRKTERTRKWRK